MAPEPSHVHDTRYLEGTEGLSNARGTSLADILLRLFFNDKAPLLIKQALSTPSTSIQTSAFKLCSVSTDLAKFFNRPA